MASRRFCPSFDGGHGRRMWIRASISLTSGQLSTSSASQRACASSARRTLHDIFAPNSWQMRIGEGIEEGIHVGDSNNAVVVGLEDLTAHVYPTPENLLQRLQRRTSGTSAMLAPRNKTVRAITFTFFIMERA